MTSVLGPPFLVSTLPDAASHPQPDVRQQFFSDIDTRRPTEISSAIQSLRLTSAQIPSMLHTMVKSLLGKVRSRTAGSRQEVARLCLQSWLAEGQPSTRKRILYEGSRVAAGRRERGHYREVQTFVLDSGNVALLKSS